MEHQDWHQIKWDKKIPEKVVTAKSSSNEQDSKFKKLDNETENFKHKTISKNISKAIQKARLKEKLSQKALAQKINVKPQVITEYEAGKAMPSHQLLMKMQKVLNVKLFSK